MISEEILVKAAYELDQAILDSLPDPKDCDHVFSPAFERKMEKMIRRENHSVAYTALKRVACILVALIMAASMLLAVNPEARAAFVGWIQEKVDDFYHYFFVCEEQPEVPSAETETGSLDDRRSYYLKWLPEGTTLVASFNATNGETLLYDNGNGIIIQFTYMYGDSNQSVLVGGGDYEEIEINEDGFQARVYLAKKENESNFIAWKSVDEDGLFFTITALLSESDLVKMARNVSVVK